MSLIDILFGEEAIRNLPAERKQEVKEIINKLMVIGKQDDFLSVVPGGPFDHQCHHRQAKDIGRRLNAIGGLDLMMAVRMGIARGVFSNESGLGTGGTLMVEDWSCKGKIVKLREDGEMAWEDDIVYTEAGPTRTMAPRPKHTTEEAPLPEVRADWTEYYQNIVDVLDRGAELIVKPEQVLQVMRVYDAAMRSAETNQVVKL